MIGTIPSFLLYAFMACTGTIYPLLFKLQGLSSPEWDRNMIENRQGLERK